MDKFCFPIETNEDAEDFDDPSVDLYFDNAVRSDEKKRKQAELRKGERRVMR